MAEGVAPVVIAADAKGVVDEMQRSRVADWLQIMGQVQSSFLGILFGVTLCTAFLAPMFLKLDERLVTTGEFIGIAGGILTGVGIARAQQQRGGDSIKKSDAGTSGGSTT